MTRDPYLLRNMERTKYICLYWSKIKLYWINHLNCFLVVCTH